MWTIDDIRKLLLSFLYHGIIDNRLRLYRDAVHRGFVASKVRPLGYQNESPHYCCIHLSLYCSVLLSTLDEGSTKSSGCYRFVSLQLYSGSDHNSFLHPSTLHNEKKNGNGQREMHFRTKVHPVRRANIPKCNEAWPFERDPSNCVDCVFRANNGNDDHKPVYRGIYSSHSGCKFDDR